MAAGVLRVRSSSTMRSSLLSTSSRRRRIRERLLVEVMDTNLIRNARMRPQPPLLAGASVRRPSASCPGEWQEALSLPNLRAEHPLVDQTPSPDLFICAKYLFVAAKEETPATRGYVLAGVRSLCAVGTSHIVGRSDQGSLRSRLKILSVHAKDLFVAAMDGKRLRPLKAGAS